MFKNVVIILMFMALPFIVPPFGFVFGIFILIARAIENDNAKKEHEKQAVYDYVEEHKEEIEKLEEIKELRKLEKTTITPGEPVIEKEIDFIYGETLELTEEEKRILGRDTENK